MTEPELQQVLQRLLAQWESECVEFKAASNDYDTSDIGKYFSALSNEANLRGLTAAWLVFGVDNKKRQIIGTDYRPERERLHSLKHQIAQGTDPSTSFREIHELSTPASAQRGRRGSPPESTWRRQSATLRPATSIRIR